MSFIAINSMVSGFKLDMFEMLLQSFGQVTSQSFPSDGDGKSSLKRVENYRATRGLGENRYSRKCEISYMFEMALYRSNGQGQGCISETCNVYAYRCAFFIDLLYI